MFFFFVAHLNNLDFWKEKKRDLTSLLQLLLLISREFCVLWEEFYFTNISVLWCICLFCLKFTLLALFILIHIYIRLDQTKKNWYEKKKKNACKVFGVWCFCVQISYCSLCMLVKPFLIWFDFLWFNAGYKYRIQWNDYIVNGLSGKVKLQNKIGMVLVLKRKPLWENILLNATIVVYKFLASWHL